MIGARPGEVVALQWDDIDLAGAHQMRRVSIDAPTVTLLKQYRDDCTARLHLMGARLTGRTWLFSARADMSRPRDPASLTRRYGKLWPSSARSSRRPVVF